MEELLTVVTLCFVCFLAGRVWEVEKGIRKTRKELAELERRLAGAGIEYGREGETIITKHATLRMD